MLPPLPKPIEVELASTADLRAEVERLRQMLRNLLQEKDRALRLLRRMNTDLDSRVRGQTQQLATLNRLINTINSSLDLTEVATTAIDGIQALVGVQAVSLALADGTGEIKYVVAKPVDLMPVLQGFKLRLGQGIVGKVIETGQAHVTNDAARDPAFFGGVDLATGFRTQSVLCEPLIVHEQVIGAIQLINKWSGGFNDVDRAFVETVAGSLAIAVENARMYEQVQAQLRDLERKNTEVLATQAQLIQSEKLASIGQLTAGLAHEVNNPVGIILGFAQLIVQRTSDDKLKDYAASIEREAMRVKHIVDDLLGFARRATLELTRVDLGQVIGKALDLTEYQLASDNIKVNWNPAAGPVWVRADGNQILQVLMNLIQNARQAMPDGGQLNLRTWPEDGFQLFSITDTGIGIPEANLDRIFDPFFTTKPAGQGTGLGLSVSYGIIARHGGEMRVTSQPGAGTTFVIRLPSAAPAEEP